MPITHDDFKQRVNYWAKNIGVFPIRIQIQPMKRKWASCSTAGRLTFSNDLLKENLKFRDQVIVHELLHLQIPNHGKLFKSLLKEYVKESDSMKYRLICGLKKS